MNELKGMDRIARADERLRDIKWPTLSSDLDVSMQDGAILVVCGGFEDRTSTYIEKVIEAGVRDAHVVVVGYLPEYEQNRTAELGRLAETAGYRVSKLTYNRESPAGIARQLTDILTDDSRLVLDISGMSRLLIVQLLVGLADSDWVKELVVTYCEAANYPPTLDEFTESQATHAEGATVSYLSKGILEIAAAAELSSVAMEGEAIRLIAFPSFDPVQFRVLLDELQPMDIHAIHGCPPRDMYSWREDAIRSLNKECLSRVVSENQVSLSTFDYRETVKHILDVYNKHSIFDKIVIAPTGSKMQAVAVGLVRSALIDLQIVYPTPHVFVQPTNHTTGVAACYEFQVPLSELRILAHPRV